MKYVLIFLMLFINPTFFAQTKTDSIIQAYEKAKSEDESFEVLIPLVNSIVADDIEEWRESSIEVITYLKSKKKDSIADILELFVVYSLNLRGDYSSSLKITTDLMPRLINRRDSSNIIIGYSLMAESYGYIKNFDKAISNVKKSFPYIAKNNKTELWKYYHLMAETYAKSFRPDSGLVYAQKAMVLANELNDNYFYANVYATTAENYIANKDYDLALPFLRKAINIVPDDIEFPDSFFAFVHNDFAQLYLAIQQYDSVYHYAEKAITESRRYGWNDQLLRSYRYMYESFEKQKINDSTYKYFRMATTLKDSLFDVEKIKAIESISFQEQLKEQEKELALIKVDEERQNTIQFALLAIGIISFIIIFLMLSRSFITSTRLIKFLSVVALLMVFEFLNLLLHPFLENITHHSPVLMLLALVCIAALLVPLHHKIEHWATNKLVEKNKQIRLAAAKKTIEQLEANPEN